MRLPNIGSEALKNGVIIGIYLSVILCFYKATYSFNFETEYHDQYLTLVVFFSGLTLYSITNLFLFPQSSKRTIWTHVFLVLISSIIVFSEKFGPSNEYAMYFFVSLGLFSLLRYLKKKHVPILFLPLLFYWIYQVTKGIPQIGHAHFDINSLSGTLENSGIYAIYLTSLLPFCFNFLVMYPKIFLWDQVKITSVFKSVKSLYIILCLSFVALAIFIFTTIISVNSRTALITFFAMLTISGVFFYSTRVKAVLFHYWALILLCVLPMLYFLYSIKKLSAIGRVLIANVTVEHTSDYFLTGIGLGRFSWFYPQWQAAYFANHTYYPKQYYFSASETYLAFNEHLGIFAELGILGFIVYILYLIYFFRSQSLSNDQNILRISKITVGLILVSSLTSYPLHVNLILMLLFTCFAVVDIIRTDRLFTFNWAPGKRVILWVNILLVFFSMYTLFYTTKKYLAVRQWDSIYTSNYNEEEIKNQFLKIKNELTYDGKFLIEFGEFLQRSEVDIKLSHEVLEQAKQQHISVQGITALAEGYKKAEEYGKAIENYTWLTNYIPSKFSFKFELVKLYLEIENSPKAKELALDILTMDTKIPSVHVDEIRNETLKLLRQIEGIPEI